MFEPVYIAITCLSWFITPIITYFFLKKVAKTITNEAFSTGIDWVFDDAKQYIEDWLNTEEAQKAIYTIGGLAGSGAAQGLGIQKRGGKRGLLDVVLELGANYFSSKKQNPDTEQPTTNLKKSNPHIIRR